MTEHEHKVVCLNFLVAKSTYDTFYNDTIDNLKKMLEKSAKAASSLVEPNENHTTSPTQKIVIPKEIILSAAFTGFVTACQIIEAIIEIKEREASHD